MNKTYISVWNDVSGTWVAAPETAKTHCGTGTASSGTILSRTETASRPATPLKAAFMPIAMAIGVAMLPGTAAAQATAGNGGLELCPGGVGGVGSSWGPLSSSVGFLDCSSTGESSAGMSFSLNNSASDEGAWGFNSNNITARVTGYDDGRLELKGTGGISMLDTVSMTDNKITDLADGDVSSSSADAVNGKQLYQRTRYFSANSASADASTDAQATGLNSVASGPSARALGNNSAAYGAGAIALAANSVALGAGSQATRDDTVSVGYVSPATGMSYTRQITNVTAGSAATDAVNVSQLDEAIRGVTGGVGGMVENAVTYNTSAADLITLKGAGGTKITNLLPGDISSALSMDAVNGAQLYQTNQDVANVADSVGVVSNNLANVTNIVNNMAANGLAGSPLLVKYDSSAQDQLTLGGVDRTTTVKLTNVAPGELSATSTDAVNGNQLYETNQNLAGLAANVGQLGDSLYTRGVKYFHAKSSLADSSADGTESVAIGGAAVASAANSVALGSNSRADRADTVSVGATGAERQIVNVAEGTQDTDAVNVAQLNAAIAGSSGTGSPNAVVYDSSVHDKLTLGGSTSKPQVLVTNLAAGQVAAGSTDAMNGDQLYKSASGLASGLGAGASVNSDGTINAPSYLVSGSTYGDVGSALNAVDGQIDQINTSFATNLKYIKIVSSQPGAQAGGTNSIAIGGNSIANGDNSLAIGSGATTNFSNSIALGVNSVADEANTVSVGARTQEKRITNVANGINLTDAATVGQLDALQAQLTASTSGGAKSMMQTPSAVLSYIAVSSNTTQGTMTTASEDLNAMAIGPAAAATGLSALAVGGRAAAGSNFSTAVGSGAGALSNNSTVIGASATVAATSDNSVSIGYNSRAGGDNNGSFNTLAVGAYASAISAGSVAIGYGSIVAAGATNGMALGLNSTVTSANAVAIGYGAVANRANVVSVGNATRQSQIINVAAGTSSTDAVNVSQLSSMAAAIGGGAAVNPDGTVKRPSFTIGGETYSDVGSALAASAGNSVQYDTSEHASLTLGGVGATEPVKLSNVANATSSTDAVNLSQLQSMGMTVDSNGNVVNSFVAYDDSTKTKLTFGGVGAAEPVKLSNVANATSSTDAVNLSQLQSMGMTVDSSGNVVNSFVAYDDSTKTKLTLGGVDASEPVKLANVANAT
ncbi:ESPR-type extended signal peptide-containing protein, partial [Paraburkholderia ginsengisoli]